MTECDDGHHRDQADLGDYEMIDNRQYGVPHSEPNDMPEVYIKLYTNILTSRLLAYGGYNIYIYIYMASK